MDDLLDKTEKIITAYSEKLRARGISEEKIKKFEEQMRHDAPAHAEALRQNPTYRAAFENFFKTRD